MKKDDVEFDEFCDPDNPRRVQYPDVAEAARRIAGVLRITPCARSFMSERLEMDLYLKQEFLHCTGSFKERGVCNTLLLLSDEQKQNGVITASTGNHGCALSYHATLMKIPCIIVMPENAPITKVTRCQKFGGKLIMKGDNLAASKHYALSLSKEKRMMYINGFDHPNVIEGQGTIGIEILEQVPNVDAVIVPVGGGSLIAGIAVAIKHLKPDTEIYGVETDKTASMTESLKKNERVLVKMGNCLADGLGVGLVGVNTFHTLKGIVDKMVTVSEDWVARGILHLLEADKFIVEGAGAVPVAVLLAGLLPNLKGKKVVIIGSGGNIDLTTLARSLERGQAAEGRLIKFKVVVNDRPGAVAELAHLFVNLNVTMREFIPEKVWMKGNVCTTEMKICVETKGWDHTKEFVEAVKKHYKNCSFPDMTKSPDKAAGTHRGPCLAPHPVCMQK